MVTEYIGITASHRRLYYSVSGTRLHKAVAAHANLGSAMMGVVPESSRTHLAAAVTESSLLAGRIEFFDLRQPESAQESFVVALQAAHDAHDPLLGSAVLAHMAFIPAFTRDTRRTEEARDKIRAARAFSRRGAASPEMLAWLDAVEAEVETLFGETRKALSLIHHAEQVITMSEAKPSPAWLDWFSTDRLAGFKGNTLMADRQLGPARQTLLQVLDSTSEKDVKQRAITLADLAAVEALSEHPEEACKLATAALENLAHHWYATGMERIRAVRQMLTLWEGNPCVRELDNRLYDWSTIVSSLTD